jgi:aminoglycoside phosphotransferase (APT) family kinase protein
VTATVQRLLGGDPAAAETLTQLTALPAFRGATVVAVEPLSRACLRVHLSDGRRVVLTTPVPRDHGSVAHEAAVLARLHPLGLPVARPVATLTGTTTVLVTEDADGYCSLDRRRAQAGGSSPAWAAAVGRGLAAVHTGVTPARLPQSDPARHLLRAWTTGHPSGGSAWFLRDHDLADDLADALHEAVAGWRPAGLVHGNVRSRTVLCASSPEERRPLLLVDWSRAGHGDPRWDLGCLVGGYLAGWLSGAGDGAFGPVRAEIRAATGAYAAVHPMTAADRRQSLRYAAVALLRDAGAGSASAAMVEVAAHLLRRPDACGELLP